MKDRIADLFLAAVLIAIGVFILLDINATELSGHSVIESVGFSTLPMIYASLLVAFAAILGVIAVMGMRRERAGRRPASGPAESADADEGGPSQTVVLGRTAATIAAVVIYALLLEHVDFFVLTAVFLFAMFQLYGQRSLLRTSVVALIGAAALHGLFVTALKLPF